MKVLSPVAITATANLMLLSRRRARTEMIRICPRDIYTGLFLEGPAWSLEHVVPQSRMKGSKGKNDLHNLGGLHTRINSSRGNKKFGEPVRPRDIMGCKVSPLLFSPMIGKGEVARKCAYMIEIYGDSIDVVNVIDVETMIEWNHMFPPGDEEKRKNDVIFNIQGSYNRFIEDSSSLHETFYLNHAKDIIIENQDQDQDQGSRYFGGPQICIPMSPGSLSSPGSPREPQNGIHIGRGESRRLKHPPS